MSLLIVKIQQHLNAASMPLKNNFNDKSNNYKSLIPIIIGVQPFLSAIEILAPFCCKYFKIFNSPIDAAR